MPSSRKKQNNKPTSNSKKKKTRTKAKTSCNSSSDHPNNGGPTGGGEGDRTTTTWMTRTERCNFVPEAGPGCHIARKIVDSTSTSATTTTPNMTTEKNDESSSSSSWVLEWEAVDPRDYGCDSDDEQEKDDNDKADSEDDHSNYGVPDIAIDPDEQTLSLCNLRTDHVVAYITVYGNNTLRGKDGRVLQSGFTVSETNQHPANATATTTTTTTTTATTKTPCTTLIVLCPPCTFAHLCYIELPPSSSFSSSSNAAAAAVLSSSSSSSSLEDLKIDSDVQVWNRHSYVDDEHEQAIGFPLRAAAAAASKDSLSSAAASLSTSFLCTQGEGGYLTHFFAGNQHAIDFQCPSGTPLVAVGDGVVVQSQDRYQQITGIAVSNLFSWNSILLQLDPPTKQQQEQQQQQQPPVAHKNNHHDNNNHNHPPSPRNRQESSSTSSPSTSTSTSSPVSLLFVEYVHISASYVQVGDRVTKGQVIGLSGGIGFSPEDHLHFAGYRSAEAQAPTVRLRFQKELSAVEKDDNDNDDHDKNEDDDTLNYSKRLSSSVRYFYPRAGHYYNQYGEVA